VSAVYSVTLKDLHSGCFVPATLLERIDVDYARRADDEWVVFVAAEAAKAVASGTAFARPEHDHWRWERKVSVTGHLLSYPTLALECDGHAQGLMLLKTDGVFGRLPEQAGHPLVSVEFLASAPWNLPTIVAQPRYRGVGTLLLRAAVATSLDLGFKGRIGLHALPQAEQFYSRSGMASLGPDEQKGGLTYFEMSVANAAAFMG
jgi:hypothetical protein